MSENIFQRTEILIGKKAVEILKSKKILICGLGGVGGFAAEALARAGIENFVLIDNDIIETTNINRQITALHSTLGKYKADIMKNRIHDINPKAEVKAVKKFYSQENSNEFFLDHYDYIIDAIDTVPSKVCLLISAVKNKTPVVSSMGTGNMLNPTKLKIEDISKSNTCPLARIIRKELRKYNVFSGIDVVYSTEKRKTFNNNENTIGSISYVPPVAGFFMASVVVNELLKKK
jgi:tRNA A37 threonylcarbamoyladenosine dehydratase